jgi:hypothetical protein
MSAAVRLPLLLLLLLLRDGYTSIGHASPPQRCVSSRLLGISRLGAVAAVAVACGLPAACRCLLHHALLLRGQVVLQCALKCWSCARGQGREPEDSAA